MAEETATAPATVPSALENAPVTASEAAKSTTEADASKDEATKDEAAAPPASKESPAEEKAAEAPAGAEPEKPAETADTEMKDAAEPAAEPAEEGAVDAQPEADGAATSTADAATSTPAKSSKDKNRRKSTGTPGIKNLKKKGSMARILHLDCQPGQHWFVKTKGYPSWPSIISDDEMLPEQLLKSRPVSAKRVDGSYREDFAEGGKRVADRTYPIMYLETNEFAWVRNTDLHELDPKTVLDHQPAKMTKSLEAAYHLAAEGNSLDHYKDVLYKHQQDELERQREAEELEKEKEAKAAEKAAKAQATPAKKSHKKKVKPAEDEDVDMADAADEDGAESTKKSSKKRKADESAETPQRTESVKKPKIKLTTSSTPKATNGATSTPKAKDDSKAAKSKPKKGSAATAEPAEKEEVAAAKEPELTPAEKQQRKEKEVLFLRHKLQRGLLTKDQDPKEDEMEIMSNYLSKLEAFPDLEVNIIRQTKINKVLKAIIKLESIPKEDEFQFKDRSQKLLNSWNLLLSSDEKPAGEAANGVNGSASKESKTPEPGAKAKTNGVKEAGEDAPEEAAKDSEKKDAEEAADKSDDKPEDKAEEEKAAEETVAPASPV